ncbi:MAG: SMC-Scp complex subunit ScpB [Candidatus Bipolaricaulota bacterium]
MNNREKNDPGKGVSPKAIIEAALFLAGDPVSKDELLDLTGLPESQLDSVLADLKEDLFGEERGLKLFENDGLYSLKIKRELLERVKYLAPHRDMSKGVLRTLSVIAYNSPVLQKEVVEIRGNGAYDHIDKLIERNFVKSEQEGRTKLLSVTDYFLDYFELDNLDELRKGEHPPERLSN